MNVLIDTHPGLGTVGADPEDALAITMALNSPELTVRAITCVHGNVPVEHSLANLRHLLELLERSEVPSAAGHELPLLAERRLPQRRWLDERARCTERFDGCLNRHRDWSCRHDPQGSLTFYNDTWIQYSEPALEVYAGIWGACVHPITSGTGA